MNFSVNCMRNKIVSTFNAPQTVSMNCIPCRNRALKFGHSIAFNKLCTHFIQHKVAKLICTMSVELVTFLAGVLSASNTIARSVGKESLPTTNRQLKILGGISHGFSSHSEFVDVLHRFIDRWTPGLECGIPWNKPVTGICLPIQRTSRLSTKNHHSMQVTAAGQFA
jgi:dTDP-4-dehydrorhamnose 3,5-epimerase-like enzyme